MSETGKLHSPEVKEVAIWLGAYSDEYVNVDARFDNLVVTQV